MLLLAAVETTALLPTLTPALATPQGNLIFSSYAWNDLPLTTRAEYNSLCVKMQQAGLLAPGPHQTGYTLFVQMSRAVRSVYFQPEAVPVPRVPSVPPAVPEFTLSATNTNERMLIDLNAKEFFCGCQVWMSDRFVPGCCDPFKKRTRMIGAFPDGWPDGGRALNALLDNPQFGYEFHAQRGAAFVVKIVPVSPDGFVGPSLSEWCVVN